MIGTLRHSKTHRDKIDRSREERQRLHRMCLERGLLAPKWLDRAGLEAVLARAMENGCGVITID